MEKYLRVGVISSSHGVRGEAKIFPTTDDVQRFKKLKTCILDTGREYKELHIESAEAFLNWTTIKIVALGLIAFAVGTASGVLFGKIMCKVTGGKVNPLIGSAGVSAVPMAARVSQKVGAEEDPTNFLLMHAMGPNVAGVIGTAVAAGVFMAIFGA